MRDLAAQSLTFENDRSLLQEAYALASESAQTLPSFAETLGLSPDELFAYWPTVNRMRRYTGHDLPPLQFINPADSNCRHAFAPNWYTITWKLELLLEEYQRNESLAGHYTKIVDYPEGGHYMFNVVASDAALALTLENPAVDFERMRRVCVLAEQPENALEALAANAGSLLTNIDEFRGQEISAEFIDNIYKCLTKGITLKSAAPDPGAPQYPHGETVETLRHRVLQHFCDTMWPTAPQSGNPTLVCAITTLRFFAEQRLYSAGNMLLAYVLYVIILHRAGFHFSSHIPVVKLLYAPCTAEGETPLGAAPADLCVECEGYSDWTLFFEHAVQLLIDEQGWNMTRLQGMHNRRERIRTIINADASMNARQKEVLLEAVLHSNAEFTYAIHEQRYSVTYPSARSDFARLIDMGLLQQLDDGVRHFFVAAENFQERYLAYLKEHCTEEYYHFYDEADRLRIEFKSTQTAVSAYNDGVGFYEKDLLDKTYVEHYDFRRAPIADSDGPRRREREQ